MIRFVMFSNKSCRMDDSKLCGCVTLVKINCKIAPGLYSPQRKRQNQFKKKERKNWQEIINAVISENVPELQGIHFFRILLKITIWKVHIFFLPGTSPAVQWLRLHVSNAGVMSQIPVWETQIPHASTWPKGKKKKKKLFYLHGYVNDFILSYHKQAE